MDLRRLRCELGGHEYRFQGIILGNRVEGCLRCGKARLCPTTSIASVYRLPTPEQRARTPEGVPERRRI